MPTKKPLTGKLVPAAGKQMRTIKVVCRSKIEGERRFPYRVLGLALDADLSGVAGAIVSAFGFDLDHAYGFYDTKNPYKAAVAFELFADLEETEDEDMEDTGADQSEVPGEAEMALMLGLEAVNKRAILLETAGFLTRRLEEQMLPLIPARLRDDVQRQLASFAAELLDMPEEEESLPLPPQARQMLRQPGGLEQLLRVFQVTLSENRAGSGGVNLDLSGPQKRGVRGVRLSELFGRQNAWTFLFDYGDDWTFDLTDAGLQPAEPRKKLPRVLESVGTAPEQYPDWDDE